MRSLTRLIIGIRERKMSRCTLAKRLAGNDTDTVNTVIKRLEIIMRAPEKRTRRKAGGFIIMVMMDN